MTYTNVQRCFHLAPGSGKQCEIRIPHDQHRVITPYPGGGVHEVLWKDEQGIGLERERIRALFGFTRH